ncbi:MAG: thiamine pyrophosphate-dependent enzyme [Dehalococcoidia bacterium]|nr:thiamine pyrophosphate-dependent enzyme [Dehalococcoidia bacterium]
MQNLNIYASKLVEKEESFSPGHRACIGCGEVLAVRLAVKAAGKNVVVVNATGCMEIIASQVPNTSWNVPWIHTLFENTAAVSSGIESGLKAMMRKGLIPQSDTNVVAIAGDGATLDIGFQSLSGAMERGHKLLYICFDNEAYMNTGVQRSSATPFGASTTTSPAGKKSTGQTSWKKDMPALAVAHGIPYVATANPSYPFDLMEKVKKALNVDGPSYIQVMSVCPTGWRCAGDLTIRLGRLSAETGVFPLYEVENGKYKMSLDFPRLRPLTDYTSLQGRFRHLTPEMLGDIQQKVVEKYNEIKAKAGCG